MLYITAILYIFKGAEDAFKEYESLALPLLKAFNGELLHRIRCLPDAEKVEEEQPYEIHLLSFSSEADFQNYLNDHRRLSLEPLRKRTIRKVEILKGTKAL